jgi:hypothetical protein
MRPAEIVSKLIAIADRIDAYNDQLIAVGFYTEDGEVESLRAAIRQLQKINKSRSSER